MVRSYVAAHEIRKNHREDIHFWGISYHILYKEAHQITTQPGAPRLTHLGFLTRRPAAGMG